MSYAQDLRQKLAGNDLSDPVRAVIYARVSTDNEGQKDSCANQVDLAKSYISAHPVISLQGIYIDDGISGKNDFTRPEYNAMLRHITDGGIDLVITKALSRLNRDELNSMKLQRLLVEHNATVLTLEDGQIHDFDDLNAGLLHSISFAIDAQYVKRQSINGRKTHELRCRRKELSAKDCAYGYDWDRNNKAISINEEQADVVRWIYEEYVYRNGSPASIQRDLAEKGIKICGRSITNIIRDERYIGKFYINKRSTKLGTGHIRSTRIKLPKEQWVLVERPDLRIVDDDIFGLAQRVYQSRVTIYDNPGKGTMQARFRGTHLFASKVFCAVCGRPYHFGYADRDHMRPVYRIKNHQGCSSPIRSIMERDLVEITRISLIKAIDEQNEVCESIERVLTECIEMAQDGGNSINKIKKQKASRETQLNNLMEMLAEGGLTDAAKLRIKGKINAITDEIDSLTAEIANWESSRLSDTYIADKIVKIKMAIADLRNFASMDRERILIYISRIDMQPNGDVDIILRSGQLLTKRENNNTDISKGDYVGKTGIQGTTGP